MGSENFPETQQKVDLAVKFGADAATVSRDRCLNQSFLRQTD